MSQYLSVFNRLAKPTQRVLKDNARNRQKKPFVFVPCRDAGTAVSGTDHKPLTIVSV